MAEPLNFLDNEAVDRIENVVIEVEAQFGIDTRRKGPYSPTRLIWSCLAKTTEEMSKREGTTWGSGEVKKLSLDEDGEETEVESDGTGDDDSSKLTAYNAQTEVIPEEVRGILMYVGERYIFAPLVCGPDDEEEEE